MHAPGHCGAPHDGDDGAGGAGGAGGDGSETAVTTPGAGAATGTGVGRAADAGGTVASSTASAPAGNARKAAVEPTTSDADDDGDANDAQSRNDANGTRRVEEDATPGRYSGRLRPRYRGRRGRCAAVVAAAARFWALRAMDTSSESPRPASSTGLSPVQLLRRRDAILGGVARATELVSRASRWRDCADEMLRIAVTSSPGAGSTFRLSFPASKAR